MSAGEDSRSNGGGQADEQGQGPSSEVGDLNLHRLSLGDPLLHSGVPPTSRQSLGLGSQVGGASATPPSRTRVGDLGWGEQGGMGHERLGPDQRTAVNTKDTAVGAEGTAVDIQQLLLKIEKLEKGQSQNRKQIQELNEGQAGLRQQVLEQSSCRALDQKLATIFGLWLKREQSMSQGQLQQGPEQGPQQQQFKGAGRGAGCGRRRPYRERASAKNPCRICKAPDHWERRCPQRDQQVGAGADRDPAAQQNTPND